MSEAEAAAKNEEESAAGLKAFMELLDVDSEWLIFCSRGLIQLKR